MKVCPPELFARTDDVRLLYRGKVHWFQGESETLKSWAAQVACVQALNDGERVLYIDFEDDDRSVAEPPPGVGRRSPVATAGSCTDR